MDNDIFLDPISYYNKNIYIKISNNSGKIELNNIEDNISKLLIEKGYVITKNIDEANYFLQANIIFAGEVLAGDSYLFELLKKHDVFKSSNPYILGNLAEINKEHLSTTERVLSNLTASDIRGEIFKNRQYLVLTNIEVAQKINVEIKETSFRQSKKGISSYSLSEFDKKSNWDKHNARLLTVAEKLNLHFDDASKKLEDNISNSIANIF